MTSEAHPPKDRDERALFAEISEREEFDKVFNIRNQIDAGIQRVLDDVEELELALNRGGNVSEKDIQKALETLNRAWDSLRFGKEVHTITGKLRATEYAEEEEVVSLVGEPPFAGLGGREEDARGYFYAANGFRGVPLGFDVEAVPLGEHDTHYRVTLQFGLEEDMSDYTIWFSVYPEELDYIEPPQPSRDGAEKFIAEHLPELFAAIEQLPEGSHDDIAIHQALDDFVATIDFASIDSAMGSEEIIDIIETYITDRIAFDTSPYTLHVHGLIYGRTMKYENVPRRYSGTLSECLIGQVRLFPFEGIDAPTGAIVYRPSLEVWYLVPERGGGRTPIYIPIDSLESLISHRPSEDAYPFDADTYLAPNEDIEWDFEIAPLASERGDIEPIEQDDTDEKDEQPERSREEELREYADELRALHATLKDNYFAKVYPTIRDARRAMQEAGRRMQEFVQKWNIDRPVGTIVEVSGEGLLYPNGVVKATMDLEEERYRLAIDGIDTAEGDMFTSRRGHLTGSYTDSGELTDGGGYAARGVLVVNDAADMPSAIVRDPSFELPMIAVTVQKNFFINMAADVEIELPELRRIEKQKDISRLLATLPKNTYNVATAQIRELEDALEGASASQYEDYAGLERLRDLALAVSGNSTEAAILAQVVEHALGQYRVLRLHGPVYTMNGELESVESMVGKVEAVIADHPYVPSSEIILVFLVPDKDDTSIERRYLVPVSTLENMEY